ncbi:MAG TPA: alpha/beta hydrolase [Sphingobacteriaceae bacterium]
MTAHYFDHPLVHLHYYKFGKGDKVMLCFHGYGMHGKQFTLLESGLGDQYTFYGFDLFFHKQTRLKDQSLAAVKKGISKQQMALLIEDFCREHHIDKFSLIGYSMGSHYATAIMEQLPHRVSEYIVAAASSLGPGRVVLFLSRTRLGNKLLEKIALTDNGMLYLLKLIHKIGIVDRAGYDILYKEIATYELRFSFYATATFLRDFITDRKRLIRAINTHAVKSIFIFGKRDKMYPPSLGNTVIPHIPSAQKIILNEGHEMINSNFAKALTAALYDHQTEETSLSGL